MDTQDATEISERLRDDNSAVSKLKFKLLNWKCQDEGNLSSKHVNGSGLGAVVAKKFNSPTVQKIQSRTRK